MTFTISKEFAWSASHRLDHLPDDHQCARLHGHNYVARIMLQADTLDARGFVVDYGELAGVGQFINEQWDHRHLNDVAPFASGGVFTSGGVLPTAESMARWLAELVKRTAANAGAADDVLVAVSISETPKTWATWTPDGWKP